MPEELKSYQLSRQNRYQSYLKTGLERYLVFILLAHPLIQKNLDTQPLIIFEPEITSFKQLVNTVQGIPVIDQLTELKISGQLTIGGLTQFINRVHFKIEDGSMFTVVQGSQFNNESVIVNSSGVGKTIL